MKKLKLLISSILAVTALAAGVAAVGCKKGEHEHSYDSGWTYNEISHWHASTCEHDKLIEDEAKHKYGDDKVCTICGYNNSVYGLTVSKTETEYVLDGTETVNVPLNDIKVNLMNEDGTVGDELTANDYTLEIYKGKEKLNDLNGVTAGAYNIWAKKIDGKAVKEAFVVVYVIDSVTNFRLRNGTFEQDLGLDIISPTWKFEVAYKSGRKENITVADSRMSVSNFTTLKERDNESATVTFSETNSKGDVTTEHVNLNYTVTKAPNSNVVINTYAFADVKSSIATDKQATDKLSLNGSNFTGANSFITVEENATVVYRPNTDNGIIEIRNVALSVTFEGVGLLELGARSTGNNDMSGLALMYEDGTYIEADLTASRGSVYKDDDFNYYGITGGAGANLLSFKITKPGKYTICTVESVTIIGDIITTASKNVRFESLTITDVREN